MADVTDPNDTHSPSAGDDALNGNAAVDTRGVKRPRQSAAADDDDDDDDKPGRERRKIDIKFIQDKSRRHITFSKRKAGIMKKVRETRSLKLEMANNQILGIRAFCSYWYSSSSPRCFRDWSCLYLYYAEAAAIGHKGRRKKPDSSKLLACRIIPWLIYY